MANKQKLFCSDCAGKSFINSRVFSFFFLVLVIRTSRHIPCKYQCLVLLEISKRTLTQRGTWIKHYYCRMFYSNPLHFNLDRLVKV